MDLAILNSNFLMSRLVEGHTSLIWTERYDTAGDFSRESDDIAGTIAALPLYTIGTDGVQRPTVVTIRDSDVPMIVETHKIDKQPSQAPTITTTGRSFETVLDRRTTVNKPLGGGIPIKAWESMQFTAVDSAYDAMNQVVTLGQASAADLIPEVLIKAPVRPNGYVAPTTTQSFQVDPGELYAWVLAQVQSEQYGFRAKRPASYPGGPISIEIYSGTDRTKEVVFDARLDQFDSATYLLSQAGWKNTDQVNAALDSLEVTDGNTYSGLSRRVSYYDASQSATGVTGTVLADIMKNLGIVDLAKQLETALFSGEVSRQQGSMYGADFSLGDVVKLTGDYGLSQFVRIAEFIRSDDNSGEKAYPTFASL